MTMKILENHSLKPFNTFGIEASGRYFFQAESEDGLRQFILEDRFRNTPKLVLGGGSNILLTRDFDGVVIKMDILGKEIVRETEGEVYIKVGAGENWHQFVLHCVQNGYAGIENLSLIPGNIGAAPMQNIGAYGVEIKEVFHELECLNVETGEREVFNREECEFGYRESVFKNRLKGQRYITAVTLRLNKKPVFNTSYGAIEKELEAMGVQGLSIQAISQAVINIRQSKLPDPAQIGNSGSFFKNPVIPSDQFETLKKEYPNIVGYPAGEAHTKVAAGWLIDQAGWKGKTFGNYGVHKNQALVLVNYSDAKGQDIYDLSSRILEDINSRFGIHLEREVNII